MAKCCGKGCGDEMHGKKASVKSSGKLTTTKINGNSSKSVKNSNWPGKKVK